MNQLDAMYNVLAVYFFQAFENLKFINLWVHIYLYPLVISLPNAIQIYARINIHSKYLAIFFETKTESKIIYDLFHY